MTFRDSSLGGNFDSQRPHSGVEYSTFWGLATPSGDSFSRSQDEVRGFDFDRSMRLVSWNRSTSLLPFAASGARLRLASLIALGDGIGLPQSGGLVDVIVLAVGARAPDPGR